ncbi:MAG: EamA family transporter, partial [Ktedonobacteraceae bacterium]|nr:EamA family transporter [Ktedonobacteraceae bacterium]
MNMMVLGLTVALLWGGADILSTYVDMDALRTTLMAQGIGLMTLVLALACLLVLWPMNSPVLVVHLPLLTLIIFGILLGGVSACSYLALYFALRRGPLAIVSPVVAAQGGVTTVGAVLVLHEHLRVAQLVAILLLIGGVMAAAGVRTAPLSKSTSPLQRTKLWRRGWQWMRQSAPGIAGGLVAMFGFGVLSLGLGT